MEEVLTLEDVQDIKVIPYCTSLDLLSLIGEFELQRLAESAPHNHRPPPSFLDGKDKGLSPKKQLKPYVGANPSPCVIVNKKIEEGSKLSSKQLSSIAVKQSLALDISKGEKLGNEEKFYVTKRSATIADYYPEGTSREEILKKERLLKRPVEDQERQTSTKFNAKRKREEKKRKKKSGKGKNNIKKEVAYQGPDPLPRLPMDFENLIKCLEGTDVKLLIQKAITVTDTSHGHNRLSVPVLGMVTKEFLTEKEKATIRLRGGKLNRLIGIKVPILIEPSLETSSIVFKLWNMEKKKTNGKTSYSYALCKPWNDVKERNRIEPGMVVQVWSFRVSGKLCLALVNLTEVQEGKVVCAATEDKSKGNIASTSGTATCTRSS